MGVQIKEPCRFTRFVNVELISEIKVSLSRGTSDHTCEELTCHYLQNFRTVVVQIRQIDYCNLRLVHRG